jgi:uncharacterized protein
LFEARIQWNDQIPFEELQFEWFDVFVFMYDRTSYPILEDISMFEDNNATKRENQLDETLKETFPASDPPANTIETGIGTAPQGEAVHDNGKSSRFELVKDGEIAFLNYERRRDALILVHTEVPPALRGHHIGDALVETALAAARAEGLRIVPVCPFVQKYLSKHPQSPNPHP